MIFFSAAILPRQCLLPEEPGRHHRLCLRMARSERQELKQNSGFCSRGHTTQTNKGYLGFCTLFPSRQNTKSFLRIWTRLADRAAKLLYDSELWSRADRQQRFSTILNYGPEQTEQLRFSTISKLWSWLDRAAKVLYDFWTMVPSRRISKGSLRFWTLFSSRQSSKGYLQFWTLFPSRQSSKGSLRFWTMDPNRQISKGSLRFLNYGPE